MQPHGGTLQHEEENQQLSTDESEPHIAMQKPDSDASVTPHSPDTLRWRAAQRLPRACSGRGG